MRCFSNRNQLRIASDRTKEVKSKVFLKQKRNLIDLGVTKNYDGTLCLENERIKKYHSYVCRQDFLYGEKYCECLRDKAFTVDEEANIILTLGTYPVDWNTMKIIRQPTHGGNGLLTPLNNNLQSSLPLPNGVQIITYKGNMNYFGKDSFIFQVLDKYGCCNTVNVTMDILPTNDLPIALSSYSNDNRFQAQEDTPASITLDITDIEAHPPQYSGVFDNSYPSTAGNIAWETLTLTQPSNGTVSNGLYDASLCNNTPGTVLFTPNPNWWGDDSFTWRVQDRDKNGDPHYWTNETTVQIKVNPINDCPVAQDWLNHTMTYQKGPVLINLWAAEGDCGWTLQNPAPNPPEPLISDIDDDTFSGAKPASPWGPAGHSIGTQADPSITVNITKRPHGFGATVTIKESGGKHTGILEYNPGKCGYFNDFVPDSFKYTITDSAGCTSNEATIEVLVKENEPPVTQDQEQITDEDVPITWDLIAYPMLPGPPKDVIDWTTLIITQEPQNGVLVHNGDGNVTYTPNLGWFGIEYIRYVVSDSLGGCSVKTAPIPGVGNGSDGIDPGDGLGAHIQITVIEVKIPPCFTSTPPQDSVEVGYVFNYDIVVFDEDDGNTGDIVIDTTGMPSWMTLTHPSQAPQVSGTGWNHFANINGTVPSNPDPPDSIDFDIIAYNPGDGVDNCGQQHVGLEADIPTDVIILSGMTFVVQYREYPAGWGDSNGGNAPCGGGHSCNRGDFILYGNGVKIGDIHISNYGGNGTAGWSGIDYVAYPVAPGPGDALGNGRLPQPTDLGVAGRSGVDNSYDRYNSFTLSDADATTMAAAAGSLGLAAGQIQFSVDCNTFVVPGGNMDCHGDASWLECFRGDTGTQVSLFSGCISAGSSNMFILDIFTGNVV